MTDQREATFLEEMAARDAKLATLESELSHTQSLLAQAKAEIELLQQKIDILARRIFGKTSEQLSSEQLQLLFQELNAPGPALGKEFSPQIETVNSAGRSKQTPREKKPSGPRLPEHLPVQENVIIPDEVKEAPENWRRIGEEVSERLDYEPARFIRLRTVRPKYVPRGNNEAPPKIARLPESILERSIVTPGLLAQVLVSKYCDHIPLYRQESIYWSRHGVWLPRQTMSQWVWLGSDWLRPIYDEIRREVMGEGYVQVDETPIRYLAPGHGETKRGYLWTCHNPGGDVFYSWHTSRAASCLETIIPVDFSGIIQCDGYAGYDAFARKREEEIELAGCWAHVRRAFFEAQESAPRAAGLILHLIGNLYDLEQRLRAVRAGPKLRGLERQRECRALIARIQRTLLFWKNQRRFTPKSLMGKAINYALGEWSSLLLYLENGRVEIDNNLVENSIRPTAVGKKNWLFFGDANAGERGAIIYTVIESCRRRGIDPYAYLRDIFTRLPNATNWQIKDLTPEAWAKARRSTPERAAA